MRRTTRTLLIATVAVAAIALTVGAIDAALAQGSPFGVGTPKSAPPRSPAPASSAGSWSSRPSSIRACPARSAPPRPTVRAVALLGLSFALRRLPCRRSRPRQGGDLVLRDRQPRDLVARRRTLVCFGDGAGDGRGGDGRHRRGAAERDRGDHEDAVYWIEVVSYLLIIADRLCGWSGPRAAPCSRRWRDCNGRKPSAPPRRPRMHVTTMIIITHDHRARSWHDHEHDASCARSPRSCHAHGIMTMPITPRPRITITTTLATTTARPGATPTRRRRASWRGRAAGSAA